jgi:adenylylsulfate reductase subunit A
MRVVWSSGNIDPRHIDPEPTASGPCVMGSHATRSGAWASGPGGFAPDEHHWGFNCTITVEGLFPVGDTIEGPAHGF